MYFLYITEEQRRQNKKLLLNEYASFSKTSFIIDCKSPVSSLILYTASLGCLIVVQLLNHVQLFMTPWTAARQASLSITISQSLLKLVSIELVMPSNHFILCHPLLLLPSIFPSLGVFPVDQLFTSGGQSIGTSPSALVLPMNIQDWFPLGLTGWISLQSKGLSRVFSTTTVQKNHFFGAQLSW